MRIDDFQWDKVNEQHMARHGVSIFEVEEILLFGDPIYQKSREEKFVAFGVTEYGRYLFIVFAFKDKGLIRVVTARDMVDKEKRFWRRKKGVS